MVKSLSEKYLGKAKQWQEKYDEDEEFRSKFNKRLGLLLFLMGRENDNSETETN